MQTLFGSNSLFDIMTMANVWSCALFGTQSASRIYCLVGVLQTTISAPAPLTDVLAMVCSFIWFTPTLASFPQGEESAFCSMYSRHIRQEGFKVPRKDHRLDW